ncbi:MAG: hypothetical protein ABSG76_26810 [Xanthobacteraceae bacterium]
MWHDPRAALGFLQGSFFAALAETFGRPPVHLLLPSRIVLPPDEPASAVLADSAPAGGPAIATLDPISGRALSLVFSGNAPGRRFDVMYHARGNHGSGREVISRPRPAALVLDGVCGTVGFRHRAVAAESRWCTGRQMVPNLLTGTNR